MGLDSKELDSLPLSHFWCSRLSFPPCTNMVRGAPRRTAGNWRRSLPRTFRPLFTDLVLIICPGVDQDASAALDVKGKTLHAMSALQHLLAEEEAGSVFSLSPINQPIMTPSKGCVRRRVMSFDR